MIGIRLFGATRVTLVDGTSLAADQLGGVKSRQLLEILALSPGVPLGKDMLAELLWQGRPPRTHLATLESYVCVLRRILRSSAGPRGVLATTTGGYLLDPSRVSVDAVTVRELLAEAASGRGDLSSMEAALALATEPLLASDAGADWADRERAAVTRALAEACARGAAAAFASRDDDLSWRFAARALELDPLAEDAARTGMQALCRAGRVAEALRTFALLRGVLADELGLNPAPETRAVYLDLLRESTAAGTGSTSSEVRHEVAALLTLLRQALESVPGVILPATVGGLADIATLPLDAA